MAKSPTARAAAPDTVWLTRGRHPGPAAEESVRRRLLTLKQEEVIDDYREFGIPPETEEAPEGHGFEARWRVADDVVVRARLTTGPPDGKDDVRGDVRDWVLAAESERPWDLDWPSPATMFWPEDGDAPWDHDAVPGLRLRGLNPLPPEDRDVKRLFKDCARRGWAIHVVVHEAMTPDERGRRPLAPMMPPGLRHRVVEHRAAPDQFHIVNWALYDLGVRVPRGGAIVLPGSPARPGYEAADFTVRSMFLDGSEPTELIEKVVRYAALPRPLPVWAERAISQLRDEWQLFTIEEARHLVATYSEALKAMTRSRDLYREAAERAHEALAAYREGSPGAAVPAAREEPRKRERFSLRALTKPLERVGGGARLLRTAGAEDSARDAGSPESAESSASPAAPDPSESSDPSDSSVSSGSAADGPSDSGSTPGSSRGSSA